MAIPPEPAYSELDHIIATVATTYKGPVFRPHMTILGDIEAPLEDIKKLLQNLGSGISELELSFGPISFSTTYFQSVFVRVNSTAKLLQINLDIKKQLGLENTVFMPHISLLYGGHTMHEREDIAAGIKIKHSSFSVKEFVIWSGGSENPIDWKIVATIPFGGK